MVLPIIDISNLYSSEKRKWFEVGLKIDKACIESGFFYIKGHNIKQERFNKLIEYAKYFFSLPLEEKLKIDITKSNGKHRGYGAISTEHADLTAMADFKEAFDMGLHLPENHPDVLSGNPFRASNVHPNIDGWEDLLEKHFHEMQDLSNIILKAMALALNIDINFFKERFKSPCSAFRLIHYPPRKNASHPEQPGIGAHTDFGCITLLYQDKAGGLQVKNSLGEWIDAPPIEGTFVVNIGDMMARWSNDRYKSTAHRVYSPNNVDRYSMPFFAEPDPETIISCLPGCYDGDNPKKYEPILCSEYRLERLSKAYSYLISK